YEVPVETPIPAKLDVSAFQRVLVAGFVAGGTEDVDTNQETVRLLRSQLRTKSELRVIDADPMQLVDVAQEQNKAATAEAAPPARHAATRLHGTQGLHAAAEVHLHRRPHRRHDLVAVAPRGSAVQHAERNPRAVDVFRVDGPHRARLPRYAVDSEDQGHPGPA